jgi:hypothetical protein
MFAQAAAMFVVWKSVSVMQPANWEITRSAACESVSPCVVVEPPVWPLRSSTSLASHATILSFSAVA